MKAVFVSDLHLVHADDEKTKTFVRFLDGLLSERKANSSRGELTHLFLVGDIFDLWVGAHDYFVERFSKVVQAVRALAEAGVEVHYFEGNHDLHLTKFWSSIGAKVHPNAAEFQINDLNVRVEHGDLINPDDKGYLFLRGFLRSRGMTFLSMNLPGRAVKAIGERASRASRDYTSHGTGSKGKPTEEIRKLIRAHAERQYQSGEFDLIISGHVHVTDDFTFEVGGRKVRSVNLGSWYDGAKAFVLTRDRAEFVNFT